MTNNKNITDWIFCASPNLSHGGQMHIDKLSICFDEREISSYLAEKKDIIKKLEEYDYSTKESPEWAIVSDDQILAHEAFHVYQTLTCNFLSEYSIAKRRHNLVALRLFSRNLDSGKKFIPSKVGLDSLYSNPQNKTEDEYFKIIIKAREDTKNALIARSTTDAINLREVVEGATFVFQLLSQFDLRNKKCKLEGDVYKKVWHVFRCRYVCDYDNDKELKFAMMIFLFLTDVYLKSKNDTSAVTTFEEAIDLITNLVDKFELYQKEYKDNRRDSEFIKSLQHVERKKSNIEKILDFCGMIDNEKHFQLYVNIRLYADVYKRIAPAGLPDKQIRLCNKHQAINYFLSSKFQYWGSNFTIPCVLSDYITTCKFITMWTEFSQIHFIDETRNVEISFEEENFLLQLYDELSIALQPVESNRKVRCCSSHGDRIIKQVYKCVNEDSLNSRFIKIFNRSLSEAVEYE